MNSKAEDFYKIFECGSKEELYQKIKTKDPIVQPLMEYYEHRKKREDHLQAPITNSVKAINYVSHLEKDKSSVHAIYIDSKLRPTLIKSFKYADYEGIADLCKDILIEKYKALLPALFLVTTDTKKHNAFFFTFFETNNLLDVYTAFSDNSLIWSEQEGDLVKPIKSGVIDLSYQDHTFLNTEFNDYYSKKENQGLNLITDNEQIKDNLKLGYQDLKREEAGILIHDKNYNILSQEILFTGGVKNALIDHMVVFNAILKYENATGFVPFHNHPSGGVNPSNADLDMTNTLSKEADKIGLCLTDHYIVARLGVASILKDYPFVASRLDKTYLKEILLKEKVKKYQSPKEKPKFSINSIQKKKDNLKQKELSNEKKKTTERNR